MGVSAGRIYAPSSDGTLRVLVDRLWPRGVRKLDPPWDLWLKEVAPSTELRRWYHANLERRAEFAHRYRNELVAPDAQAALAQLVALAQRQPIALLTATRHLAASQVPVLVEVVAAALR